ncbi:MAG: UPF0164 family protein [Spirochaetota bacterium]
MLRKGVVTFLFFLASVSPGSTFELTDIPFGLADMFGADEVENTGLTVFPTLMIPTGGEYESMGTAYTAVARDISFFEANPAASSRLPKTMAAIMHNNLIADANMEGLWYTTRFEHFGIGAGLKFLHVPFTEYDPAGSQEASIRYTETVAVLNASYNFLHSYDFRGVSVGANIKAAHRNIPEVIAPGQSAFGVMMDVGALTRFDVAKYYPSREKNFSVGIAARNLGPAVQEEPLPSYATLGIAYAPLRPLTLSADYNVPFILFSDLPAQKPYLATGLSGQITDFLSTQLGFMVRGGNPRISLGTGLALEEVKLDMNYTLDMTTQTNAVDRFSIQASFDMGDRGRGDRAQMVEDYYLESLVAFAEGNIEETIRLAGHALEIDPTFQPAAETLASAQRLSTLQRRMSAIRLGEDDVFIEGTE